MRTREEIENQSAHRTSEARMGEMQLEVLLDIRELIHARQRIEWADAKLPTPPLAMRPSGETVCLYCGGTFCHQPGCALSVSAHGANRQTASDPGPTGVECECGRNH